MTLLTTGHLYAQQLAFPGAEGYGRFTTGGRGGEVIEVTNLNDSGPGSLRAAVNTNATRTIVFRVSGTITLESRLEIKYGNLTIAGQTAPGDGICLRNYDLKVEASNVIIRYLRSRLGDSARIEADAMSGTGQKDIIIDHCSVSWSVDECMSFYGGENVTIQWCLISESLHNSVHSKGPHGYGGIWGGVNCSFHHNMFAHHTSRNPRFNEGDRESYGLYDRNVDHRNNVIYNWGSNSAYGGKGGWYNLVNNYYKYGPATSKRDRIVEPYDDVGWWYIEGNFVYGYPEITADNWAGGVQNVVLERIHQYTPFPYASVVTHTAENTFEVVLADVGASLRRDSIDARIVHEARTGTATHGGLTGDSTGIIDSQEDVGGWPELHTYDVPADGDHDGMADDWEAANGLDSTDASDRNGDFNGDGYTNLEKYLNSLCERTDFLMAPAELAAITLSHEEVRLTWKENALNESGFAIERSTGDTSAFVEIGTADADAKEYVDSGLSPLTTYHYRVRAFNAQVQSIYTTLAQVTTLDESGRPLTARNPTPADSSTGVKIEDPLHWEAAVAATSYEVYLGTTLPPQYQGTQTATEYEYRDLQDSTTYYWRVDAVNDNGTTTGAVWRFTTAPFTKAMIAYWPLDEGYSSLAEDVTGNGHWAYLKNMPYTVWITGRINTGLEFDGVEDFLEVRDKELIDITVRSLSITFWLKQDGGSPAAPWLSKAKFSEGSLVRGYEIYHDETDKVGFAVGDGEQVSRAEVSSSGFSTGAWIMVTAVRDRSDSTLRLYANTDLLASAPDSTWNISSSNDLYVGTNKLRAGYLKGVLDEVRIYNYALDETEIQSLYDEGMTHQVQAGWAQLPHQLDLGNYPNPFNSSTIIAYSVPRTGHVNLAVYDLLGREVISLLDDDKVAGSYTFRFDAARLSSGIYYIRLAHESQVRLQKMILLK
ncbi:MAG: T9SS type A sorting domain-containing protein [Fidelibacterota bacterium]|nr:MAG: T9SS type A sorting domain-containing protein [Candidatus Neomarinimicrobiota bacterium]